MGSLRIPIGVVVKNIILPLIMIIWVRVLIIPVSVGGDCPSNCGLCSEHESHTTLGLIDVTNRCNLLCPVCFANAAVSKKLYEPSFEEIRMMLRNLRNNEPVPAPAINMLVVSRRCVRI